MTTTTPKSSKRHAIANMYPLSPMQEGLLFHTLLTPQAGTYMPQVVLTFSGVLDSQILRQAWQTTLEHHDILRTGFYWEQRDQPFQVVYRQLSLPWVEQDWQTLSPREQTAKLEILLACNRDEPFNLNQPPLMRLTWVALGDNRYHLIWCYHHLILDGWSTGQVLKDVFQQYFADIGTLPTIAIPTPPSYGNYIAWLNRQDPAAAQNFWKTYLDGWWEPTALPILKLGKAVEGTSSNSLADRQKCLSAAVTKRLRNFCQQHQLTLNNLVQGALGLLLSRYCNTDDAVFGATYAGRPPDLTGSLTTVGLFINTLPVRVKVKRQQTVLAWLQRLSTQQSETTAYDYVSLRDIQGWVNGGRSLFDCLLVFESYPVSAELFQGQTAFELESLQFNEWTHFPLTLLVSVGDSLTLTAKYRTEQISADAIERFLEHFSRLIVTLAEQPHSSLPAITLLSKAEQDQIRAWNQTDTDYPLHQTLPDLLFAQAEKTPEAVALIVDEVTLTYRELHQRANQLAHRLQKQGIGPEHRVAIYLERSVAMMVAILAVVKAGATYVPLDPSYPQARLQWMLEDAAVAAVLTDQSTLLPTLPSIAPLIDVSAGTHSPTTEPQRLLHPDNSVYIIYTSGSTGQPKGVINTHRGLVNRLQWMQETYALSIGDRVLQKTPLSFDVSVWELFWPLLNGATLVVAKPGGHKDNAYLVDIFRQQNITTLHFVPSMLAAFLEAPSACPSLKQVICSGEALSPELQRQFFEQFPDAELHNLYGPTEAAIDVTAWRCQPGEGSVPIGHPIANTRIYLLDQDYNPVPVGIPGELYISGTGVARGYLNQPALTAERFIPNPFADRESDSEYSVLYKTGDLARYRSDGGIEYLNRQDSQIKLRGVRMELGEVESVLAEHPNISQTAVLLREDLPSGPALVAYVVGDLEETPSEKKALTTFLQQRLPSGFIPQRWVMLDALPLTPNGKLDRRSLPLPEQEGEGEKVPPRNPTEVAIANIWTAILQIEDLSIDDNFFELGGHSLSATRANTRLRQQFNLDLPLHSLFTYPTIETLAIHIDALSIAATPPSQPTAGYKEIEL
ncbi:amino acid adenylation domain-containing protein [Acaryochloris sp. IP29b_bin.137]|uniref:amino acid adenylation domain-containing protein n=1 Tax=Acaryochloris sp. IP29b_bin.137 TaxID=2969217 RepID=UPI00261CCDAB|nr:amino acid adenylation domain-containing protein [Acaryochloris sp. IP29b_bin.137]